MLFDPFESIVLFLAVLTVNYVVQDGKSNWLEGMILMCLCVLTFPLTIAFSGADVSCWNVGILLWQWCSGFTLERNRQDSLLAPPEAADRLSRFSGCLTILSARFGRQIFIPDEPSIRSLVSVPIRCLPPPAYMISFLYSLPRRPPTRNHPPPPISPRF